MKKILLLLLFTGLILGCNRIEYNYNIFNGSYGGYFDFKDTAYWYSINFENNIYEEGPSGRAYF